MNSIYQEFLQKFSRLVSETLDWSIPDCRVASTRFFSQNAVLEPIYQVNDQTIEGPDGNALALRICTPCEDKDLPVLLFFHQGGWAFGSVGEAEPLCRQIANAANCIVVAVEYRLAPENPFPMGLEDCYAATQWVYDHATSIGGDRNRIAVGGESAGGNLAAAVCLMARDRGGLPIKFQLLLYPAMTNEMDAQAYAESEDQVLITWDGMAMYWKFYLRDPVDGDSACASPLKAKDLSHLPPAFMVTAEFDPLHREAEAYARRLLEAGVPVVCKRYTGAIHSFLSLPIPVLPERIEGLRDIQAQLSMRL